VEDAEDAALAATSPALVEQLLARRREFLSFLEARVASRATAEELLQTAFVRTLEKGHAIRDDESAVAWFYRVLRNALADHYRKHAVQQKAHERLAVEPTVGDAELERAVCQCVDGLLPTLKPEYAGMLERVDLQGASVSSVADELGITANNATVRLHRARQTLKRQLERMCGACARHGCLDCTCGGEPALDA
jgi:RNA polymerase sigma-70 factor (ECF subfamily)